MDNYKRYKDKIEEKFERIKLKKNNFLFLKDEISKNKTNIINFLINILEVKV